MLAWADSRIAIRIIILPLLLIPLGACTTQHSEVMTYRKVIDQDLPRPKAYEPGETLTMTRALALANEDNEQLAINGENYLQALIAKNLALAAFMPTVSLQPDYTIEQAPRNAAAGATLATPQAASAAAAAGGFLLRGDTYQRTEVPVVGSMTLSIPSFSSVASDNQVIEQQKQLLLDAQATILLNVAQAYYQVLGSEMQVRVLTQSLQVQQARLADVQSRFANHLALALEVSQTLAQVASTRVDLTSASNDVRNGRRTLALLIGVPQVDGPLVDDVGVPGELPPMTQYLDLALAQRQDLLAAEANVRAEKYAVDAAIAQYYPSISIDVAGFLYRQYYSSASKWDAIFVANFPIFSAGVIENNIRAAWSRLRQAALQDAYLRREIQQEVQNAYDDLATAQQNLANLCDETQAAADALAQSEQLLKNGLAIPLDVLTAQQTLLDAQLTYTNENFSIVVLYLDLLRSMGELNPRTPRLWQGSTTRPATLPATTPSETY